MTTTGRLAGKVAIVTGAGSGIGRATATTFAAEGAAVVVVDRAIGDGEQTVDTIRRAGGRGIAIRADVTVADDVDAAVGSALSAFGAVDVLHNNAGISMAATAIEDTEPAFFERMLAVNLRSVFLGARAVAPHMKARRRGVILNTGSTAGLRPRPGAAAYAASKGGVIALTQALAAELAPFGIRVLSINPFATDTPMLRAQIGDSVEARREREDAIPLGRLLVADDIARTALFLASDEAAMITGSAIAVDGGRLL